MNERFAVAGYPISHSLTPYLMVSYSLAEIDNIIAISTDSPTELISFIKEFNIKGTSVTSPLKKDLYSHINVLDPATNEVRNVNFIENKDTLIGKNTDVYGIDRYYKGEKIVLIVGAGTTASTIIYSLKEKVSKFYILSDNIRGIEELKIMYADTVIEGYHKESDVELCIICKDEKHLKSYEIEIIKSIPKVVSLFYGKSSLQLDTTQYYNGFDFLKTQFEKSYEKYIGSKHSPKCEYRTLNYDNIKLIGMPGVGKTTLGKLIAEKYDYQFYDTDDEIKKEYGMSPKKIILTEGIESFRKKEAKVFDSLNSIQARKVISTGGGLIENAFVKSNIHNSIVYWLKTDLQICYGEMPNKDERPLFSSYESYSEIYEKRKNTYFKYANIVILAMSYEDLQNKLMREIEHGINYY